MEPMQCTEDDALSHENFIADQGYPGENTPSRDGMDDDMHVDEPERGENRGEDDESPSSSQQSEIQFSQPGSSQHSQHSENPSRRVQGRMPASYMKGDSITDATRYPLTLRRYYHEAGLLVPKAKDLKSIESQSKIFSMEETGDLHLATGDCWSFVDFCLGAVLSDELKKVVYLFDVLNSLSNHHCLNHYVVPTEDLGGREYCRLKPKYAPDQKTITGVLFSELQDSDEREERNDSMLEDDSGDLQSGTVYRLMPLLTVNVGFTAAVFRTAGSSREEFALFGVVTVMGLANVDTLELIKERLLAPPPVSLKSFAEVSRRNRELIELLEHIIIYQSSRVMGDMSNERPKDYFCNPGGRLGIDKVCHPGFEPYKMCCLLERQHGKLDSVRIIGYPDLNWAGDRSQGPLKDHWNYIQAQRAHQMHARAELEAACVECNKKKDKRSGQEEKTEWHVVERFGWPVRRLRQWYCEFVASLCPINMRLRRLRELDPNDSFHKWGLNAGSIPPLALCMLRCCLLFDPDSPESSQLDGVLLRELDVKWNLAMIRQRFYSGDNRVLDHIAVPGCQLGNFKEIMRFIRNGVETGTMSPTGGVQMLRKAMEYGMSVFVGMAESNSFLSQRVTQAMDIMRRIEHKETQEGAQIGQGLRTYRRHLLELDNPRSPSLPALLCPYDRARRFLLLGFVDVNRFEHLNSGNLQLKIEQFISMVGYTVGPDNKSHGPIGRGIELAPGCGTLKKKLVLPGGKCIDVRVVENANSAGKDFSSKKVTDAFTLFCDSYGVRKCQQGLKVLRRFTPVALENLTTLQFENGEIIAYPDETLNGFFYIITESRGNTEGDQDALIKFAYTRGDKQDDASFTTCEGKNKVRSLMWKESISSFGLCTRCSNEPLSSSKAHEQSDTLAAVTIMLEAGSAPYEPGAQEGEFNSIQANPYEARSVPLEGHTASFGPALLAGHLHCTTYMGLPNMLGTYLCEINPPTLATLDWLTFFSQKHLETLFHTRCKGNHLLRLQRVYEARATSFTAWCKMVQYLTDCQNREAAIRRAVSSFQVDAIALTDCVSMLWSLIRRCLHWGPVLYASCFIRECGMPIVPTHHLVELLRADQPPGDDSPLRQWYDKVCTWLEECVTLNRFCPAEGTNMGGDVTEYISSAGQGDGSVERVVLRVNLTYNAWNDKIDPKAAPTRIATSAFNVFGAELNHSCSVSRDALVCAIEDMLTEFEVDIQKLLEVNMFDMRRHLRFFRLEGRLNFKCLERIGAHPFMTKAVWQRDPRDVASVGAGIHFVQLLVLGSMIGTFVNQRLHPKIINDLSMGLIKQIMRFAPKGILPGGVLDVRSFDCFNGKLESQQLDPSHMQAENFIRPSDVFFAESGELSRCRNFENFAAEDLLHMGPQCEVARLIGCRLVEVPASAELTYYIRPGKHYCVHNPLSGHVGVLYSNGQTVQLEFREQVDIDLQAKELGLLSWQEELRSLGFTMLPMIWRSGACVAWEGKVGCIVPHSQSPDCNFGVEDYEYEAILDREERIKLPVLTALQMLLPIGQRLYLRLETQAAAPFARKVIAPVVFSMSSRNALPTQVSVSINMRSRCALQVHVDSPNTIRPVSGKIYVVCLVRQMSEHDRPAGSKCETIVADPWDLLIQPGERRVFENVAE